MLSFSVYRWKDTLWVNGTTCFQSGEILCDYLNLESSKLEVYYNLLKNSKERLRYVEGSGAQNFDHDAQYLQKIFSYLDQIMFGLKPFQDREQQNPQKLFVLLNQFDDLFFDDRIGQFGATKSQMNLLQRFEPACSLAKVAERVKAMSHEIRELIREYMVFCEDVLRVKYVFSDFLDHYYHIHSALPTIAQAAEAYHRYAEEHPSAQGGVRYKSFLPYSQISSTYGILHIAAEGEEIQSVLCEVIRYNSLGAFLTAELFYGMQSGQIPKRCSCCQRYFLLSNGYYPEYCDNLAPQETTKTCREVGAKKKHESKVKSNPIWLAHQRAYKTHYARFMKKKLTEVQFRSWSKFAGQLRDQMLTEAKLPADKRTMTQTDYEIWLKE
jgi:hypothetical protein